MGIASISTPRGVRASSTADAIAAGATQSVTLPHPVPVYMLYWTAFVDPDGTVEFRDDIYGRDRRLAQALAAQRIADHLVAAGRNADKG